MDAYQHVIRHFLSSRPILEPTNRCNMRCTYCGQARLRMQRGNFDLDNVSRLLSNTADFQYFKDHGQRGVILQGFGEPFVHPRFYDLVDVLAAIDLDMYVVTNGKWELDGRALDSIFKISDIRASVDAVDNNLYRQGKPGQDVERILDKFRRLIRRRYEVGSVTPVVRFRMNVFEFNKQHVPEYIRRCQDIGVDGVCLVRGGGLDIDTVDQISPDSYMEFGDYVTLDEAMWLHDKPAQAQAGRSPTGHLPLSAETTTCRRSSNLFEAAKCHGMTFRWDGTVTMCCRDPRATVSPGNIFKTDLLELLSRDRLDDLASPILAGADQREGQAMIACDRCPKFSRYLTTLIPPLPHCQDTPNSNNGVAQR